MCDHFFWIVSYPFFGQSDCAIKAMLAPLPFHRESFSHQSECVWYPKGCRVVCMCFFKVCFTMILRWMSILLLNLRRVVNSEGYLENTWQNLDSWIWKYQNTSSVNKLCLLHQETCQNIQGDHCSLHWYWIPCHMHFWWLDLFKVLWAF